MLFVSKCLCKTENCEEIKETSIKFHFGFSFLSYSSDKMTSQKHCVYFTVTVYIPDRVGRQDGRT